MRGAFEMNSLPEHKLNVGRSSQCFPLEQCSLGVCVEQTMQDIMYNGVDSFKMPDDDEEEEEEEEEGEADDEAAQEMETENSDDTDVVDEDSFSEHSESDPHYPNVLRFPESCSLKDCIYVVKWGGTPGAGKVDFEIRSKRQTGILGFCYTKETVSSDWNTSAVPIKGTKYW